MTNTFKTFLNESSLGRVYQHTKDRNIGMISASRGEHTAEENKTRNNELEGHIKKAGYGYIKVKGRYVENHGTPDARPVDEHSFLVIGKKGNDNGELKSFLSKHGEKYSQDSILHKSHDEKEAKLHFTKNIDTTKKGDEVSVGEWHPNRANEFHTLMKGGKTFAFESIQFLTPISFFARQEKEF